MTSDANDTETILKELNNALRECETAIDNLNQQNLKTQNQSLKSALKTTIQKLDNYIQNVNQTIQTNENNQASPKNTH